MKSAGPSTSRPSIPLRDVIGAEHGEAIRVENCATEALGAGNIAVSNGGDDVYGLSILVVDDQPANVRLLQRILERLGYRRIGTATSGRDALAQAQVCAPDIILLDLHMPDLNGIALMGALNRGMPTVDPLVIVLTGDNSQRAKEEALLAGARDFIAKPFNNTEVGLRLKNLGELRLAHNRLRQTNLELATAVAQRTLELELARLEVLDRLAMAAELRDDDTGQHTRRVGALSASLAQASGMSETDTELIARTAPLHDVGKIAIPDHILLKPGALVGAEITLMRTHAQIGAKLLAGASSPLVSTACEIAISHHERWNGRGYPYGLSGNDIPKSGRIVAIADFFDALSHDRPYRRRYEVKRVLEMVRSERGQHFDPALVDAFLALPEVRCLEVSA